MVKYPYGILLIHIVKSGWRVYAPTRSGWRVYAPMGWLRDMMRTSTQAYVSCIRLYDDDDKNEIFII